MDEITEGDPMKSVYLCCKNLLAQKQQLILIISFGGSFV